MRYNRVGLEADLTQTVEVMFVVMGNIAASVTSLSVVWGGDLGKEGVCGQSATAGVH